MQSNIQYPVCIPMCLSMFNLYSKEKFVFTLYAITIALRKIRSFKGDKKLKYNGELIVIDVLFLKFTFRKGA